MEAAIALRMPPFHRYRNQGGNSGVVAYALLPDAIAVQFADGRVYLYNHDCPGRRHVSRMRAIAREGQGLSTYISRHVGNRFAARLTRDELELPARRPPMGTREQTAIR
jgi:hypothetical protein